MNLFENLQLMKESDSSIISEFKEFLASKNAQYIYNELGEIKDGMQIVIYDGDWKHEHLYMKHLIDEFFTQKGMNISITSEEIGESDQDTYSARYNILFNTKPKTYVADVIPLKFTTEDVNSSDWKQTDDENTYVSDKYPEYQIKKSYTSSEQETWQVLNSETQREVFVSGTFEGAIEFVENKKIVKESNNDIDTLIDKVGGVSKVKEILADVKDAYPDIENNIDELVDMSYSHVEDNLSFREWSNIVEYINESESLKESNDIDLDDYEYVGTGSGHDSKWSKYRRFDKELNKGVWVAKHQETGEIKPINYDQALGYEPIEDSGIARLSRDLGRMLLPKRESANSEWEFIEKTTTKDDIFGDISEGNYYIKQYNGNMTGYIYPPSESEKLYRAKLISKNHIKSLGYNAFIELDSAKEFLDEKAYELTPVTLEDIKTQLEEIDTHEHLKIYIDNAPSGAVTITIEGTLINEEPITLYDSSYIRTQGTLDFIKEKYIEASKEIDAMRKRGYLGVKDEAVEEDYDDNAATFLDTLEKEIKEAAHKFMLSVGFPEDEADDYLSVSTDINDDYVMVAVGAELGYDSLFNLCQELDKVIAKHDEDAYFEPECPGRIVAYLFGEKAKNIHKEKEQALKDKINSLDKMEETNHNIIEDRDYATGEEMYRELEMYLNSLDQIAMDGKDCNWEPSEFNAKNLNADGEIYLECGAYILIYPYINEWAEDYFRVIIVEASNLSIQLKNGIERIFNKFKTDKWKLVFEG